MTAFADIADMPEDDRIGVIGKEAMRYGGLVAFCTDSEPGKADRYVRKLLSRFPELEEIDRFNGPVDGLVTVKVRRKAKKGAES
jgi:hypothetical protein